MTTHHPRRRRLWRWLAAFVVCFIGLLGGGLWLDDFLAQKTWTDACAEADRFDPGWRWDDLMAARPIPPDERNVSFRIGTIRKAMPQIWPDWVALLADADLPSPPPTPPPKTEPEPPGAEVPVHPRPQDRRREYGANLELAVYSSTPTIQIRRDQLAALRKAFTPVADAVTKTQGLEGLITGRLPNERDRPLLNNLLTPRFQDARQVAQLLRLHAAVLAYEGQLDAALADCRRMLGAVRAAGAEPMFIDALVAMAIRGTTTAVVGRVLAQGEPGPESLEMTRRSLDATLAEPIMLEGLRGERAFFEDTVRSVDEGLLPSEKAFDDPSVPKVTGIERIDQALHRLRAGGTWGRRDSAAMLRYYSFLVEIAKESPDALRARSAEIAAYRANMTPRAQKATEFCEQMFLADRRNRALVASTAVALAAEQFRRANNRWPKSLGELVAAKLLAAVPLDPFDGQPLRMRRLADGLVIYSVGQDLSDDGGEVRVDPMVGGQPKDVGVRLWDVPHRRQSPLNR